MTRLLPTTRRGLAVYLAVAAVLLAGYVAVMFGVDPIGPVSAASRWVWDHITDLIF